MDTSTEQNVNIPLLRKAVEWVEQEAAKPEVDREWFQGAFICDPRQRAWTLIADEPDEHYGGLDHVAAIEHHCGTTYCVAGYIAQMLDSRYATRPELMGVDVSKFAADALGISAEWRRKGHLFHADNTAADVRRIAEDLAGERL